MTLASFQAHRVESRWFRLIWKAPVQGQQIPQEFRPGWEQAFDFYPHKSYTMCMPAAELYADGRFARYGGMIGEPLPVAV